MKTTIVTAGAVTAIGGVAADPDSAWSRSLRKPRWQPPPSAYALGGTPVYATIACAGGSTAVGQRRCPAATAADHEAAR